MLNRGGEEHPSPHAQDADNSMPTERRP